MIFNGKILILVVILAACRSDIGVKPGDLSDPAVQYIYDESSRYAQMKMRKIRRAYAASSVGFFVNKGFVDGATFGNGSSPAPMASQHFFRPVVLKNKSEFPVYAQISCPVMLDVNNSAGIRNIRLPRGEKVEIMTIWHQPYKVSFYFGNDSTKNREFQFTSDNLLTVVALLFDSVASNRQPVTEVKIKPRDLKHKAIRFIGDEESKISQMKLRKLRRAYGPASVGFAVEQGVVNSGAFGRENPDVVPSLRFFRPIKITNKSGFPVFASVEAKVMLDEKTRCDVKGIRLPRDESFQMITISKQVYEMAFGFENDPSEIKRFKFVPDTLSSIDIHYYGVNQLAIIPETSR